MIQKNKIRKTITEFGGYELDGSLQEAIQKLQGLISQNPNFFDINIEIETESGYYGSCSTVIRVYGDRWETDEEFEYRVQQEEIRSNAAKKAAISRQAAKEKAERTLYENLKKKFET